MIFRRNRALTQTHQRRGRAPVAALSALALLLLSACTQHTNPQDSGTPSAEAGGTSGDVGPGGTSGDGGAAAGDDSGGSAGEDSGGSAGQASGGSAGQASGGSAGSGEEPGGFDDSFDGTGPLLGYTTHNPDSLPDVRRDNGRYRAHLVENSMNQTMHYHHEQGRLDAKLVSFPFEVVARNIGIGRPDDSQTAPAALRDAVLFAGIQVHHTDLDSKNWSFLVVGHKGSIEATLEGKNTVNGVSVVDELGHRAAPAARADLRIVGNPDRTLSVYWQQPNLSPGATADNWTAYRGTARLPGPAPTFGADVYVGLITYAGYEHGLPIVGTCDAIELR